MSTPTVYVYPRLYNSVHPGQGGVVKSSGDAAVDLLYGMLIDKACSTGTWNFRKSVIDLALTLFGNFNAWVSSHRENPEIAGMNRRFIEDTLRYIETGERELRIENWIELVSEGQPVIHLAGIHENVAPRLWQSPSTAKCLQQWCSHQDGVEDLLGTLHLLFGRART